MVRITGGNNVRKLEIAILRRQEGNHPPLEPNDGTRTCGPYNMSISNEMRISEADPHCIRLDVLRRVSGSSYFLCNARIDLHRLSLQCRIDIFVKLYISVPEFTMTCNQHLYADGKVLNFLVRGLQSFNELFILRGE